MLTKLGAFGADARRRVLLGGPKAAGVAQRGDALLGVAANNASGEAMALFFLASWAFTNMSAFLVIHAVGLGLWPSPLIADSTRAAHVPLDGAAR